MKQNVVLASSKGQSHLGDQKLHACESYRSLVNKAKFNCTSTT